MLAVLGPYNFPAHLPNGHIVPALIAGNAVVFKPSEKTPATGAFLVDCFHQAKIPEGVVRLLIGGPDEGRALAAEPGIDGLLFTGSARAGRRCHRPFSDPPTDPRALSRSYPIVVWDAKDVGAAATIVVQSAYLSAGQRCTAARRLIVEDGKEGPLLETIQRLIDRIIVDEPFADPQPFMGPLIDQQSADHLQEQWLGLMMKGGKPLRRLDRPIEERPYLTPALIDVTDVGERPDEELFGPVLQLVRVKDFDAAIDEANNTRFGLAASLVGGGPPALRPFLANVRAASSTGTKPTNGAPSNARSRASAFGQPPPERYYAAAYWRVPGDQSEAAVVRAAIGMGSDPKKPED